MTGERSFNKETHRLILRQAVWGRQALGIGQGKGRHGEDVLPADSQQGSARHNRVEDWAGGATFDQSGIERQRPIVLSEWRMNLGADERTADERMADANDDGSPGT